MALGILKLKSPQDYGDCVHLPLSDTLEAGHLGMFPMSSEHVILHKLPCKTILRLGDVLF